MTQTGFLLLGCAVSPGEQAVDSVVMGDWGRALSWHSKDAYKVSGREWKEQPFRYGAAGSGGEAVAGADRKRRQCWEVVCTPKQESD